MMRLTETELRARALTDLRLGLPVCVADQLICAAETLSRDRFEDLRKLGAITLVLTQRRAQTLNISVYDHDICRIRLDAGTQLSWIGAVSDPTQDMAHPLKGPFNVQRGGDVQIARQAVALCKAANLLPAAVIVQAPPTLSQVTRLPLMPKTQTDLIQNVASAALPIAAAHTGKLHIYRPTDGGEEHYAMEIGTPKRDTSILVRLHSACFTGDVLGSLKCDCGAQLNAALHQMGQSDGGVLLYLNQEGRGIGLTNKMRAYRLQSQGFDTVEANHRLGFEDDERDFQIGARILQKLGIKQVRLMTNNPKKVERLSAFGITVTQRVPLKVGETPQNKEYLKVKARKSGHYL